MSGPTDLPADFQRCAQFHGHVCPGLALGYRATRVGLAALAADRALDEELIAIVENDSCAVDAVQVLAGCTFGKGNLFVRDHGKQVYTFALRHSGRAVRVALRAQTDRAHHEGMSRDERTKLLLSHPAEELFEVRPVQIELPQEAQIHKSVVCDECGEPTMETRVRTVGDRRLCIPCADRAEASARG